MECYYFCQQSKNYFKTSSANGMNCTPFKALFFRGSISRRWAQHKRQYKSATLITWSEFKAFLWKNFGSSQAFIDSIWSKFTRDSQYQLEEVRDWASHLQQLQSILSELNRTPNELTIICYFRKDLKLSIKVEIEQQDRKSMNFEEIVQTATNAEAKAGLKSSTMVQDSDIRYLRGHRSFISITSNVQTKGTTAKDSHPEEPKIKEVRPTLSRAVASKLSKQACKERKKTRHQERRDKKQTPASTANETEIQQKKKKKNQDQDVSKVMCFNCNKKGHYISTCTKPLKNCCRSWQPPCRLLIVVRRLSGCPISTI